MGTYKFKCTLLSDIVISQSAADEGEQKTLDFIPGGNFLGIAAGSLYEKYRQSGLANLVFHSGNVRFGDAHAAYDGCRSLKVPASMYYPKLKSVEDVCYIYHLYNRSLDTSDNGHPAQLKQCRENFYIFKDAVATKINVNKAFSIKSAYDRKARRSADEKMYGYQSLRKGSEFYFEIDFSLTGDVSMEKEIFGDIRNAIEGRRHLGRSRTAQYGLVDIEYLPAGYTETPSMVKQGDCACVYADGRLVFTDDYGLPKMLPDAEDLGFGKTDEILWDKSQVRTFQYAPWNGKRHSRDTDRCGIEKGSVFVVRCSSSPAESDYVGSYRSEGFGKVIYNPDFLQSSVGNGISRYKIISDLSLLTESRQKISPEKIASLYEEIGGDSIYAPLLDFLASRKLESRNSERIYAAVNDFVHRYYPIFNDKEDKFASQWGSVRMKASCFARLSPAWEQDQNCLFNALFSEEKVNGKAKGFLMHGTAMEKWKKKDRVGVFKNFLKELMRNTSMSESEKIMTVINLASEMAKKSKY